MSSEWRRRSEAGSGILTRWFIRWVASDFSAPLARAMLWPITGYFLLVRRTERRASRNYLRRVLHREPGIADVARHVHTFAASILDRVAFLSGQGNARIVRVHGVEHVHQHLDQGRGVLLFGSHLGSFEALRHVGFSRPDLEVRILMDFQQNPQLTTLLHALNPKASASIIDSGEESTLVLLKIHETLQRTGLVSVMADRVYAGESTVISELLGGRITLSMRPFRIAAVTGAPVVLIFGLLRADGTYDVYFEPFAERIEIRRGQRDEDAGLWASRYAARLEARIREAPFNWFNFYDYWSDEQQVRPRH